MRGAGEVRQFEAIRLRSELNTRRILETVDGTRRAMNHYSRVEYGCTFIVICRILTNSRLSWNTFGHKGQKTWHRGCAPSHGVPHQIASAVPFRSSSGLCPLPRRALLTPHSSLSSSYHSLSPLPPSHVVVCLSFFFQAFLVSHPPSYTSSLDLTIFVHFFAYSSTALLVRSKDW